MDINSINNSLNTLNTTSSNNIDRSSSLEKPSKTSNDEGLNLSINQYNKKRDELSLDVQSSNNGIAISKIAQNGIEKQKTYLNNIQDKLINNENYNDKNDLKKDINEQLRNFNQVAYETKYKKENLLVQDRYEENNSIEINTKNRTFSIEKPNTANYANEIFDFVNNLDLNKSENLNAALTKVESSINQLQNNYEQFTELGNALESNAKISLEEQQTLYNNNQQNRAKNFGNESVDFSKSNVTSNVGYLVASQANIVQEQSVRLLS